MKKLLPTLFLLCTTSVFAQQKFTISGYVKEKGSQEQLPGVNVYIPNTSISTSTNNYGFFSLTLPENPKLTVVFSFVGYQKEVKQLSLTQNLELDIFLTSATELDEITVSAKRQEERVSDSPQMSKVEVPIQQVKKIPALMGEKDVLKVLQLMPGVQKGTEGQSGLYVRGGGPDQNLLILDDATVYNANHLFGFFSVFNGDALKSVELTKGGFPARYGGRLSSVIEMQMKEGNKEAIHGEVGIGLISSRFVVEGPLVKNKSSFIISGRRTYADLVFRPLIRAASKAQNADQDLDVGYYFYDLNAKINYDFGKKDKLYLSGYFGQDRFHADIKEENAETNSSLFWGNATGTLRWNHLFNQKLFMNNSLIFSKFNFNIGASNKTYEDNSEKIQEEFSLDYLSKIQDITFKSDFDFFPIPKHSVRFGLLVTQHFFTPRALAIKGSFLDTPINMDEKKVASIESGLYLEDTWQPIGALKLNGGFRMSHFQTETKNYFRPEPRLSAALKLSSDLSVKASYAKMNQYIHLLSNTGAGLPTDLWVPTTDKVAPQQSEQVAAGFAKDFDRQGLTLTVEGYYKRMSNIISYKEGASFLGFNGQGNENRTWEDNVTSGRGWSYGAEFLLQKKIGKFSGWAGYTLSWTKWQFDELNFGKVFYPRYDRRHDISLVGIYDIKKNITLSATWVYGTGNALTLPIGSYNVTGDLGLNGFLLNSFSYVNDYGEKNSFRAEPYHRLDVSVQFNKKKKRGERTIEVGIFNAYNRKNPFYYDLTTRSNNDNTVTTVLRRVSLLPLIPSISYNFKF